MSLLVKRIFIRSNIIPGLQQLLLNNKYDNDNAIKKRYKMKFVNVPKPGEGKAYRRIVHYPEEYTVKPLNVTNLGGRDPITGRIVCKRIGGGIKHKYHWVDFRRTGPTEDVPPRVDRVIQIIKDGCRTAFVALVGSGNELKYILATENMKAGDLIRTSSFIPRMVVRANEGDAFPLGALAVGTHVNSVERYPGAGAFYAKAAGTYVTILRNVSNRVIVKLPSKIEVSLSATCMATVGRLSNVLHGSTPLGTPQKSRELGIRPKSGWWQRKSGIHGRKIRKLPPVKIVDPPTEKEPETVKFTRYPRVNFP